MQKTVRHPTPLRYPGGKQRLAPFVEEILAANNLNNCEYAEPYAGGAGVAITLLLRNKVSRIHLNDACPGIYAFWASVLSQTEDLCSRILETPLTVAEWRRQKEIFARPSEFDSLDLGFSLFYLNRVNRSGIVANGGLIGGLKQTGKWLMDARFPRQRLVERIVAIGEHRDKISLYNLDAEAFLKTLSSTLYEKLLVYCDPPYFRKADRLYLNHYKPADHAKIAEVIQSLETPWLVSYDVSPELFNAYAGRRSFIYKLQYSARKAYVGSEVFFFSDGVKIPETSCISEVNEALGHFHSIE